MNLALCKCGIDMSAHPDVLHGWESRDDQEKALEDSGFDHLFSASGTKYRCEEPVKLGDDIYMCPRPRYHDEHGVECGPLVGTKLWE